MTDTQVTLRDTHTTHTQALIKRISDGVPPPLNTLTHTHEENTSLTHITHTQALIKRISDGVPSPLNTHVEGLLLEVAALSPFAGRFSQNYRSLLQNIISFIGLFCQKRPIILRSVLLEATPYSNLLHHPSQVDFLKIQGVGFSLGFREWGFRYRGFHTHGEGFLLEAAALFPLNILKSQIWGLTFKVQVLRFRLTYIGAYSSRLLLSSP